MSANQVKMHSSNSRHGVPEELHLPEGLTKQVQGAYFSVPQQNAGQGNEGYNLQQPNSAVYQNVRPGQLSQSMEESFQTEAMHVVNFMQ